MLFAFVFESVGAGEWLVLLAVLLVVMGPKNIPATMRKIGNYYSKFRRAADSFKRQLMEMDYELERTVNEAAADIKAEAEDVMPEPDYFGDSGFTPPGEAAEGEAAAESVAAEAPGAEAREEPKEEEVKTAWEKANGDQPNQES